MTTKRLKYYLVSYETKEFRSELDIYARDKLEARKKAKRKGRFGIRVLHNQKDIDRLAYDEYDRMSLTNLFTNHTKGYFPYKSVDFVNKSLELGWIDEEEAIIQRKEIELVNRYGSTTREKALLQLKIEASKKGS